MKILFCAPCELKKELGKSKIMIELGEVLAKKGWQCDFLGRTETLEKGGSQNYNQALQNCLKERAFDYDVVEFEHDQFEFPDFPFCSTVMVARVSLLAFHYTEIRLPHFSGWKDRLKSFYRRDPFWGPHIIDYCKKIRTVCEFSDLVNVANGLDVAALHRQGIAEDKIVKIPYGLSDLRLSQLQSYRPNPSAVPTIAWIGTFDQRKGGVDLARIIPLVQKQHPQTRWKLMGTAGLFQTQKEVYDRLPSAFHSFIEVIPRYDTNELLNLLQECWVGLFPSYIESFGFGVLEMMSAGLPVVAYDSPGPQEMLPERMLVLPGAVEKMADRLNFYLGNPTARLQEGKECAEKARSFTWAQAADLTEKAYLLACNAKRAN